MTNTCKRTGTVWTHGGLTEARIARPVPRVPGSGRLRLLLVGGTRLGPLGRIQTSGGFVDGVWLWSLLGCWRVGKVKENSEMPRCAEGLPKASEAEVLGGTSCGAVRSQKHRPPHS